MELIEPLKKKEIERVLEENGYVKMPKRWKYERCTRWTIPILEKYDCMLLEVADLYVYVNTVIEYGNDKDEQYYDQQNRQWVKTGKKLTYFSGHTNYKILMGFMNLEMFKVLAQELAKKVQKARIEMITADEDLKDL